MTATERLQVKIAIRRKLQPIVYGSPTATGVWYDMGCLGATDLDTGTDKVNPPKNNNYVSQLSSVVELQKGRNTEKR